MRKTKYINLFGIYLIFLANHIISPVTYAQEKDFFREGKVFAGQGEWEKALNTWWQGKLFLQNRDKIDPRLGLSFIELATRKQAKEYYESASDIYTWSFSKPASPQFLSDVIGEAERLIPLLPEREQESWKQAIAVQDTQLSNRIKSFWVEMDFRPNTAVNERLIEHWERIQYARTNFTKNKTSVYDCDDRGTIYVKYGKPDRKQTGFLGSSLLSITIAKRWGGQDTILDDPTPEYELWAYDDIGTEEPAIFFFSYRYAREEFGLLPGIDYAIPQFLGNTKADSRAMYMLKYYAEVRLFDDFFYDRFSRIRDLFETRAQAVRRANSTTVANAYTELISQQYFTNKAEDQLNPVARYANGDRSEYMKKFGTIKIVPAAFRYLDNQNRPMLAIITATSPQFSGESILEKTEKGFQLKGFNLLSTMIIRDQKFNEVDKKSELNVNDFENISIFRFEHTPRYHHFTFASELYTPDSDSVFALGSRTVAPDLPLYDRPDSLELSDLIIGVKTETSEDYPFPVFPAEEFLRNDPVNIYFEIYHLKLNSSNKSAYSIEIGVIGLDKAGEKMKENEIQISFSYDLERDSPRVQEQFGIDIAKLKPGYYELFVKLKDKHSFQEKMRTKRFRVVKK